MADVISAFAWLKLFEDDFDGVEGSRSHSPEQGFEFGEDLFDRVEVGAERAKVPAIRRIVGKRSGGCRAADIASAFRRLRGIGGCRRPCGQAGYR